MKSTDVLKKPVDMVVMRPKKGSLTLIGRRVYTMLLFHAQNVLLAEPDESKIVRFQAPLADVLRGGNFIGGELTLIKKYLKEMVTTAIEWDSTNNENNAVWEIMAMLSYARIEIINRQNVITWEFNSEVNKVLRKPDMYAQLNIAIATSIPSYTGTALYEICVRYKDNPTHLTREREVEWWIDTLSQTPQDAKNRIIWPRFKDRKLLKAIKDVNEHTDLTIKLIERKVGREISFAQFSVNKKVNPKHVLETGELFVISKQVGCLANSIGIKNDCLNELGVIYGESLLKEKLDELSSRINDPSSLKIENTVAYLKFLLNKSRTVNVKPIIKEVKNVKAIEEPSLRAIVRDAYHELPEIERRKIMDAVMDELKAKNMFGVMEMKSLQNSTLRPGLFGTAVIERYGKQLHGDKWPEPTASF